MKRKWWQRLLGWGRRAAEKLRQTREDLNQIRLDVGRINALTIHLKDTPEGREIGQLVKNIKGRVRDIEERF